MPIRPINTCVTGDTFYFVLHFICFCTHNKKKLSGMHNKCTNTVHTMTKYKHLPLSNIPIIYCQLYSSIFFPFCCSLEASRVMSAFSPGDNAHVRWFPNCYPTSSFFCVGGLLLLRFGFVEVGMVYSERVKLKLVERNFFCYIDDG